MNSAEWITSIVSLNREDCVPGLWSLFCRVKADLSEDGVYGISLKPESFGKKPFYFLVSSDEERQVQRVQCFIHNL